MASTTRRSSRLKVDADPSPAQAPATVPKAIKSKAKAPRPEYKVDDCVMLRSDTLGEPYFLGRIMSFPDPTHVRIAWFYRPQDVLSKTKAYPPRLLVASMHSDINPLRSIVAKCTIKHLAEIAPDADPEGTALAHYVQQDNTFYYAQLFDRFTKRVYDVVPTHTVTNRPPEVLAKIKQFPYILVEEGKDKELKASYQECRMCGQWVPRDDALECVECQCVYHATCLAQVKKPRPGYKWQCHFCTVGLPVPEPPTKAEADGDEASASEQQQQQQEEQGELSRPSSPPTTGSRPRTSSNTFPWTYFGIHCTNTDAHELDPRHPFYPRIASRIASKYQATIPKLVGLAGKGNASASSLPGGEGGGRAGNKGKKRQAAASADPANALRHISLAHTGLSPETNMIEYLNGPGPSARGDGSGLVFNGGTEEAMAAVDDLMTQLAALDSLALPASSTALLDRAMFELHHSAYSVPVTLDLLRQLDATHVLTGTYPPDLNATLPAARLAQGALHTQAEAEPWTPEDEQAFVDAVKLHGFDLQAIHEKCMPRRSMPALVLHLYRNKKHPQVEQALATFLHEVMGISSPTLAIEGMFESQLSRGGGGGRIKSPEPKSPSAAADFMSSDSEPEDIEATQCTLCHGTSATGRYVLTNVALSTPRPVMEGSEQGGVTLGTGAVPATSDAPQTVTHANLGVANPDSCHVLCDICGRYWMMYGGLRPAEARQGERDEESMDVDEIQEEASGKRGRGLAGARRARKRQAAADDGDELSDLSDVEEAAGAQQPAAKKRKTSSADIGADADPPAKKAAGKRSRTTTTADVDLLTAAQATVEPTRVPTPTPPAVVEPSVCHMCREEGDTLLKCADCGLCVHDTCYCPAPLPNSARSTPHGSTTSLPGLLAASSGRTTPLAYPMRKWRCGPCVNMRHPTESLDAQCLLCPHEFPVTPAQPMKRTSKHNWVHAMCALWVPEVKVGSADSLEPISGIEDIPKFRWESLCSICTVPGGVTVSCAEQGCGKEFHVSCAFRAGCYFGLLEQHVPSTAGRTKTVSVPNVWCRQHIISDAQVDPACKAALMHAAGVAAAASAAGAGATGKGGKKSGGGKAAQQQQQALVPHGLHVLEEGGDPFPPGDIDWRTKKGERMEIISRSVMRAVLDYAVHHKRAVVNKKRTYPILTGIQPSMAAPPTASVNAARAVISGVRASLSAHSSMEFHAQQQQQQQLLDEEQGGGEHGAAGTGGLRIKLKLGGGSSASLPSATGAGDAQQHQHLMAGPKCSSCLQRTSPVWWPSEVVLAQVDAHLKNGDAHIVKLAADATAPRLCMACFART